MKEEKGKDNASFEAHGEETRRCHRFAEFEAERITTEFTEVATLRVRRVGGSLLG